MQQLRDTRDQLKLALAGQQESANDNVTSTTELANRIKQLESTQTITAESTRTNSAPIVTSEEPIAARIYRRIGKVLDTAIESAEKERPTTNKSDAKPIAKRQQAGVRPTSPRPIQREKQPQKQLGLF